MSNIETFISNHSEALAVAGGWMVHVFWPDIKSAYPYLRDNGGVFGVIKTFFKGQKPQPPTNNEKQ